jgi:hypothetical protein
MQVWTPADAPTLAGKTQDYLDSLSCQKKEDPNAFMPALLRVVESVKEVTVLIINDGTQPFRGTAHDDEINKARAQVLPEMKQLRQPVITTWVVKQGKIDKWGVSSPELRLPLPSPPAVVPPALATNDESLPLRNVASNPASASTIHGITTGAMPLLPANTPNSKEGSPAVVSNLPTREVEQPAIASREIILPAAAPKPTPPVASRPAIIMTRDNQPSKSWMDLPTQPQTLAGTAQISHDTNTPAGRAPASSTTAQQASASNTNSTLAGTNAPIASGLLPSTAPVRVAASAATLVEPEELAPNAGAKPGHHEGTNGSRPHEGAASDADPSALAGVGFKIAPDFLPAIRQPQAQLALPRWALFGAGCLCGAILAGGMVWRWRRARARSSLITSGYSLVRHPQAAYLSHPRPRSASPTSQEVEQVQADLRAFDAGVDRHHAAQKA